ncbi:MAG TPA: ABC transporter permease [Bryobacteraceae bacterium]|nr:ABC transporter permease [Bryobacteraceae bacterium]
MHPHVSIVNVGGIDLLDILKPPVLTFQDFIVLTGRSWRNVFRAPHYLDDVLIQMDTIGVGSLFIVLFIGLFSGLVMGLQLSRTLATYGATAQLGQLVSVVLVRELGPVLVSLLVAGRNASGIASELGSMKVTEQIDAMRALGTDPVQKLVTPRLIATAVTLPLLTILADLIGLMGGYIIGKYRFGLPFSQYWTSSWQVLEYNDVVQGLVKPFAFAIIISLVGCFYGMRTSGGTEGVGRSTTKAVVVSSIWIFIVDFVLGEIFVNLT